MSSKTHGHRSVVSVVGARPQFIKMAVVDRALTRDNRLQHVIVHTGQHYDDNMSRNFFTELEIPAPDANLEVGSGSHGVQTASMLERLEAFLASANPALVLVYGDTNSTLAGALAAAKLHFKVAHVESGLRSFNREMPEEINRVLTDHVSNILFAPTEIAVENLRAEGLDGRCIHRVGDVMYDAALFYADRARHKSRVLERLGLETKRYVLATVHRAENTDRVERLASIMDALSRIARRLPVVLPIHPRTRAACEEAEIDPSSGGITVVEPLGYLDMVELERNARVIATDSGGVQKESYFHGVPCVTLRDETEWLELVEAGVNVLVGATADDIVKAVLKEPPSGSVAEKLYGEGDAAERIVNVLGTWVEVP